MSSYIEVVTTCERQEDAQRIARRLVDERLAACVQILGPITSVYRWKGAVETAVEWQCRAKSRADLYERLESAIRQLHSYDVPEILALPVLHGGADYLRWLDEQVGPPQGDGAPPGSAG